MAKPILCVDFDGVIHSYTSGWKGVSIVSDPPTKGALKWLWRATEWFDVQIYSSRSKDLGGIIAMQQWMEEWCALEFSDDHPMRNNPSGDNYPITFAHEKPAAFLTIDDRAICFEGDWNELDAADMLNFKPWNKRQLGATGSFPDGVLNEDDEGELKMGVAYDPQNGIVRLHFGKPVAWLGLPPATAVALGKSLIQKAGESGVVTVGIGRP